MLDGLPRMLSGLNVDSYAALGFFIKLRREEKLLTAEFGDEYRRFKQNVPTALVPFIY